MAAMALIGNGCMGNAKHAESVSGGTTDSLYLLVGSYARRRRKASVCMYSIRKQEKERSGVGCPAFRILLFLLRRPTVAGVCGRRG